MSPNLPARRRRHARPLLIRALAALVLCVGLGAASNASTPDAEAKPKGPKLMAKKVAAFNEPTSVVPITGTGTAYVTERSGRIFRLALASGKRSLVADLRPRITTKAIEQGLLSSAPAPDFATSGRLYVYFSRKSDGNQEVAQLQLNEAGTREIVDERKATIVITDERGGHNGGQLRFGPDELLYIGVGDGGNTRVGNRIVEDPDRYAQNLSDLRGKILRIRPQTDGDGGYEIPADNPYADPNDGRAGEILAWGLRNPWRFSYDPPTNRFFIGDVGAQTFEEVNVVSAARLRGANFEWSAYEARSIFHRDQFRFLTNGVRVKPSLVYRHSGGRCSVTGGVLVRGKKLPLLKGRYVYADYCQGRILSFKPDARGRARKVRAHGVVRTQLNSFALSADGTVWFTTLRSGLKPGAVYRLAQR